MYKNRIKGRIEATRQGPKAWWEYNKEGFREEVRNLYEDGKALTIKYIDTPGLFDEIDNKSLDEKGTK